ncbi:MAG: glycosyltransferase [Desulfurococcaceae archaeon]
MVIVSITPEIYLEGLTTYAGGLGVLEGDRFYAAGDMGLDYYVFTLLYRSGYVDIVFDKDKAIFKPQVLNEDVFSKLRASPSFKINLKGEEVIVQPWIYSYKTAKAILFEAVCPLWARKLTERVYVENDHEESFLKYALLAKATLHYLKNIVRFENIRVIDLQEAYTSLILLATSDKEKFRLIIHTPGPWGHPFYPGDFIVREFGHFISDYVSLTSIALSYVKTAITVSEKHRLVMSKIFQEYSSKIRSITNGIYLKRWMNPKLLETFEKGVLSIDKLIDSRRESKEKLNALLKKYKDIDIGDRPVILWARRLVRYKRPYFIARYIEENPDPDVVYVIGGKPHPKDVDGTNYMNWFRKLHLTLNNVVYIHDYDVEKSIIMHQASDIHVFTPFSGWEACGTSYMKALVNGTPVLASRDGGVLEIINDGFNGWLFGENIVELINIYTDKRAEEIDSKDYAEFSSKLKNAVKLYYNDREKYWEICMNALKSSVEKVDVRNVLKKFYLEGNSST